MENFATRREGTRGDDRGSSRRAMLWMIEGFIQIVCHDALFAQQDFCWARPFCLQHLWLNRALMRRVLCSAVRLLQSLSLIYYNVGLCGGEPAPLNWLTHLTRREDETYPSIVCAQKTPLNAECHDWYSSNWGPPPSWAALSGLCDASHLCLFPHARLQLSHILWLLCLINPA